MKKNFLSVFAVAIALASVAFTAPKFTGYWVYTSEDNSGFKVASKYEILDLDIPSEGCVGNPERPCVYVAVSAASDAQALQALLNQETDDASVIAHSISKQEFFEE